MSLFHRHQWEDLEEGVLAFFQKQEGQPSRLYCEGHLQQCRCDVYRFIPANRQLLPVEVEKAWERLP